MSNDYKVATLTQCRQWLKGRYKEYLASPRRKKHLLFLMEVSRLNGYDTKGLERELEMFK